MRVALQVLCAALAAAAVSAHSGHSEDAPKDREATFSEQHMSEEHHLDNFDIQAFFHLHDLNRDGVLDTNEIESIYGVHHEKVKKATGSVEVHTEQAKKIVRSVLDKLDTNDDGVLTLREFVAGGVAGLPMFEGVEHLGHHYDAEGEYFLHHEEKFHSTPETQGEESYVHPEDIEHFLSHELIEEEEEERIREFIGDDAQADALLAHSGDEEAPPPAADDGGAAAAVGGAVAAAQKVMADPSAGKAAKEAARAAQLDAAKAQASKFAAAAQEAAKQPSWGAESFAPPRKGDKVGRMRKGTPYKYKMTRWKDL